MECHLNIEKKRKKERKEYQLNIEKKRKKEKKKEKRVLASHCEQEFAIFLSRLNDGEIFLSRLNDDEAKVNLFIYHSSKSSTKKLTLLQTVSFG